MPKKRGQNEGTIGQRKDGTWYAAVSLGNGKRKWKYGKTRKEVATWQANILAELNRGSEPIDNKMTVTQYMAYWLEHTVKPGKARTYESYRDMSRLHIEPHIGHIKLVKLRPQDIQHWLSELRDKRSKKRDALLSTRTIEYAHGVLSRALNDGVRLEMVQRNVAEHVDVPKPRKYKVQPVSIEHIRQLLDGARGTRRYALYVIGASLGLRRGELIALKWADVDMQAGTLHIADAKTESGVRTLPLAPWLVQTLEVHRAVQNEERDAPGWKDHQLVFPSEVGTPYNPHNLWRSFKADLKRIGLPQSIRLHDLRHAVASLIAQSGYASTVARDVLGHSTTSITERVYIHSYSADERAALEDVARKLQDTSE
jgi:integrase